MALLDRSRLVPVLTVLIVAVSACCLWLALTQPGRPADGGTAAPRADAQGRYEPADFAPPAGPALQAATTTVPLALTYDYRDLRGGLRAATAGMTTGFAKRFAASFDKAAAPFVRRKEVAQAVVTAAGVVSASDDAHVRCLLFIDQHLVGSTATQGNLPPDVVSRSRVRVELALVDGTWKVADIAPV